MREHSRVKQRSELTIIIKFHIPIFSPSVDSTLLLRDWPDRRVIFFSQEEEYLQAGLQGFFFFRFFLCHPSDIGQ